MSSLIARLRSVPPGRTSMSVVLAALMVAAAFVYAPDARRAPDLPDFGVLHNDISTYDDARHVVASGDEAMAERLSLTAGVRSAKYLGDGRIAVATTLDDELLTEVTGSPVDEDPVMSLEALGVSDAYAEWQWPLHNWGQTVQDFTGTVDADIDAAAAFRAGIDGSGVVVAVLDSGVDHTHPDLDHARWRNTDEVCGNGVDDDANGHVDDCYGWDFANGDNTPYDGPDSYFHGTHVASTIAAAHDGAGMVGVAPGVKVMDVKLTNGSTFLTSSAAAGIRYAVDNGADIVNASWSTTTTSAELASAVAYAESHGVLIVAAAGNRSANIDTTPAYPAAYPNSNVLTVASSTASDTLLAASSFGAAGVDVAAPGQNVIGAMPGGGHAYASGTSMAVPHVVGTAALLLKSVPATPSQLRAAIMSSADDLVSFAGKVSSGGRLNVAAALGLPDPDVAVPQPTSPGAGAAAVTFTGFGGLTDTDVMSALVSFTPPQQAPPGPYRLEGQLLSLDPLPGVVQGLELFSDGVRVSTDSSGSWEMASSQAPGDYPSQLDVAVATALPSGRYALVVSMVSAQDRFELYDDQQAVIFDVVAGGGAPPAVLPETPPTPPTAPSNATPPSAGSPTSDPSGPSGSGGTVTPPPAGGSGSLPATTAPAGGPATTAVPDAPEVAPTTAPAGQQDPSKPATGAPASGSSAPGTTPPSVPQTTVSEPTPTTPTTPTTPAPPATVPSGSGEFPAPVVEPGDPVSEGAWRLDAVSPNVCEIRTVCTVTLSGKFPHAPNVWFGNVAVSASTVMRTPTMLRVDVPKTVMSGTVDVSLRDVGINLTMADAFTFSDPTVAPTTTAPAGSAGSGAPTTVPVQPAPGGGAPSTTAKPSSPSPTTAAPTQTTTPAPASKRRQMLTLAQPTSRNGLTVSLITSGNPLRNVNVDQQMCRTAVCGGVAL